MLDIADVPDAAFILAPARPANVPATAKPPSFKTERLEMGCIAFTFCLTFNLRSRFPYSTLTPNAPAMTTPSTSELIDIISARNTLGEGVLWDPVGARTWW